MLEKVSILVFLLLIKLIAAQNIVYSETNINNIAIFYQILESDKILFNSCIKPHSTINTEERTLYSFYYTPAHTVFDKPQSKQKTNRLKSIIINTDTLGFLQFGPTIGISFNIKDK